MAATNVTSVQNSCSNARSAPVSGAEGQLRSFVVARVTVSLFDIALQA
jgi:hypothetical protein